MCEDTLPTDSATPGFNAISAADVPSDGILSVRRIDPFRDISRARKALDFGMSLHEHRRISKDSPAILLQLAWKGSSSTWLSQASSLAIRSSFKSRSDTCLKALAQSNRTQEACNSMVKSICGHRGISGPACCRNSRLLKSHNNDMPKYS